MKVKDTNKGAVITAKCGGKKRKGTYTHVGSLRGLRTVRTIYIFSQDELENEIII